MLKKAKKGQSLIEYGLIIAVVAVIAVAVVQALGTEMRNTGESAVTAANEASTAAADIDDNFGGVLAPGDGAMINPGIE